MEGEDAKMPELEGVTHRWLDVRGIRMHIAEAGSGEPLILLHGFPQNWWEWHGVIPRLAEHYWVIAPDHRGFGWSDAPARGYTAGSLVADILELMAKLGITRARFLTHDWGAIVGQLLAIQRPGSVEALVITGAPDVHIRPNAKLVPVFPKLWHAFALAAPVIGPRIQHNRKVVRHLFTAFEPDGGVSEEDMKLYNSLAAQPRRSHAGSALYRGTILPAFMGIIFGRYARRDFPVPTLALIGAKEPSATLQQMGHRRGRGGNITTEIVQGEGHFIADHQPELVAGKTLEFFRTPRAA
ncbi:pimeloyl-ACP methyl ester carboxylesterase [Pseudarthrobacter defluvii]|uniref:alpha/beta fold hydrolase n=1 Tax=Pseudarthrobacter defluvii TaxID=410837 RepID=UPI002782B70D|nr:alpha/beta hydrolase [Pseudarthrobacter defluvii]MDQ0770186.1 pimeloyl-ACP methyl ester carboxylesterase [Pseudarthrobacter defluvii]